jgi:hypothetical protein
MMQVVNVNARSASELAMSLRATARMARNAAGTRKGWSSILTRIAGEACSASMRAKPTLPRGMAVKYHASVRGQA